MTRGCAWPRISGPHAMQKSSRRLPSSSMTCAPDALLKNTGVPPTLRNARTGLDTPAGMSASAREKSAADRAWGKAFGVDGSAAGDGPADEFVTLFVLCEFG